MYLVAHVCFLSAAADTGFNSRRARFHSILWYIREQLWQLRQRDDWDNVSLERQRECSRGADTSAVRRQRGWRALV